jgi:hypothetical protein
MERERRNSSLDSRSVSDLEPDDVRFSANVCSLEDDGYATTLAFADSADAPTRYAIIQFTNRPSESDVLLGHDAPHVEIHPSGLSGYGLIRTVDFAFPVLTFVIEVGESRAGVRLEIDIAACTCDELALQNVVDELKRRID